MKLVTLMVVIPTYENQGGPRVFVNGTLQPVAVK